MYVGPEEVETILLVYFAVWLEDFSLILLVELALFEFWACLRGILFFTLSLAATKDHLSSVAHLYLQDMPIYILVFFHKYVYLVMSFHVIAYSMSRGYLFVLLFIHFIFILFNLFTYCGLLSGPIYI